MLAYISIIGQILENGALYLQRVEASLLPVQHLAIHAD
jgi:hypothetical protein